MAKLRELAASAFYLGEFPFAEIAFDEFFFQPRLLVRSLDEPPPVGVAGEIDGIEIEVFAMPKPQRDFQNLQTVVFLQPADAILARPECGDVIVALPGQRRVEWRVASVGRSPFGRLRASSFFISSYSN